MKSLIALFIISFLAVNSTSAQPQSPASRAIKNLNIGETVTDRLTSANEVLEDGSYAQRYLIQLTQGQIIQITLQGDDFDAYLMLQEYNGATVAQDDDGAGGTDARINYTAPKAGLYVVIVNSLGEKEEGEFALFVEHKGGATAAKQITVGQRVTGILNSSSSKADDDSYFDAYQIRGVPNTTITITYESADFDAYLNLGVNTNGTFESLATDDDGAGGTNSQLVYTFADARTYEIRANTLSEGETGSYSLSVTSGGSAPSSRATTAVARNVMIGQTVSGELTSASVKMDDDSHFDEYTIVGEANATVSISLMSTDFDAYLLFGRSINGNFESITTNDDGDGGTNSLITYTFADAGTYTIRANTMGSDETGKYILKVTRLGTYRAAAVNSLPETGVNKTVNGELSISSLILPGETAYSKDYRIRAGRNDNIEFTLDSDDFDTVLELLDSNYNSLEKNDDYTDGTNSQIVYRFAAAGTYVLRVSALESGETGSFALKTRKR